MQYVEENFRIILHDGSRAQGRIFRFNFSNEQSLHTCGFLPFAFVNSKKGSTATLIALLLYLPPFITCRRRFSPRVKVGGVGSSSNLLHLTPVHGTIRPSNSGAGVGRQAYQRNLQKTASNG